MRFRPATYAELAELVKDCSIYLGDIDTSRIENMRWLFCNSKRKDFSGIESWDTSNVKNMIGMFSNAIYFNADISGWNVAKVRDFSRMFCGALRFNHNLDSWAVDTNAILLNDIDDDKPFHAAFFESPLQQNPPKWYLPYIDSLFEPKTRQYIPKNEDELCDLVAFERVNLGDIDTSLIMDLQWLCMYLKRRKDFSGIERWSINEKCHISRVLFDDCILSDNPPKWFKDRFA